MRNISVSTGLVLALSAAFAGHAKADPNFLFKNMCSPSLHACAGIQIFTTALAGGGTAVTIKLRNLEGIAGTGAQPGRIAALQLYSSSGVRPFGTADPFSYKKSTEGVVISTGTGNDDWDMGATFIPSSPYLMVSLDGPRQGGTFGNAGIAGCTPVSAGFNDFPVPSTSQTTLGDQTCGHDYSWLVFTFNTTGSWQAQDVSLGLLFAIGPRTQYLPYLYPDACGTAPTSTFDFGAGNPQACDEIDAQYATAPEPVTVALLGTGLLGMGAVARRRKTVPADRT